MTTLNPADAPITVPAGPPPKRRVPGWARGAGAAAAAVVVLVVTSALTGQHELTSSGTAQAALRLLLPILLAGLG
ncbi:MAG: ral nucleoside transport system permease protein, partial [Pseudonocardiales bacterium]|nr:ral nucleoside transport system permease protein [Pseudonocardiales bacterium]